MFSWSGHTDTTNNHNMIQNKKKLNTKYVIQISKVKHDVGQDITTPQSTKHDTDNRIT